MVKQYARITNFIARAFRAEDRGVTSVEYGIMVALVAIAIITAVTAMAGGLEGLFNKVAADL